MTADTLINEREVLIERCIPFFEEVKNMTAGPAVERWLNEKYGPESELRTIYGRAARGRYCRLSERDRLSAWI